MNTPYVKKYNELGQLTNPINGRYQSLNAGSNRRGRRAKQPRFMSNANSFPLLIVGSDRYAKRVQFIAENWVTKKKKLLHQAARHVIHYVLCPKR